MERLFNTLVVISLMLTNAYWFIPYFDYLWLKQEEINLLDANGWGSILPTSGIIYWSMYVFWVVVSIGLLVRVKILRCVYFIGLIVFGIAGFFWGFSVLSPIEAGIGNILSVLDGIIISMAYFTSVANSFR